MKIAQVAPLYESVPPKLYGGTERVVHSLTEELVRAGHEVTLFASGDSLTSARLVPMCEESLRLSPKCADQLSHHVRMMEQVFREKDNFDFIHFHVDYLHFPLTRREKVAHVTTLHGRLDLPDLVPLYRMFPEAPVVSISDSQREPLPWLNWQGTVHHGLAASEFTRGPGVGGYLAFLGRVAPEKGLDQAIEIARRAGLPLRIAAKVDRADREYFDTRIRPLLKHPLVEFIGEIGQAEKNQFLGDAAALLFPVNWPEPFGLVMIEAMACGTPVIAYPCGSVPEVVEDGVTGFIVPDVDAAVSVLPRALTLSRRQCRRRFEQRFSAVRMAEDYVAIYQRLLAQEPAPITLSNGVLNWMKLASPSSTT